MRRMQKYAQNRHGLCNSEEAITFCTIHSQGNHERLNIGKPKTHSSLPTKTQKHFESTVGAEGFEPPTFSV